MVKRCGRTFGWGINVTDASSLCRRFYRHPSNRNTFEKIARVESAKELAMLVCAVGLTQNLAALKALVTEGIQRGHMSLQAKSLAMTAGAEADEIEKVATFLQESKQLNVVAAKEFINKLRSGK